MVNVGDYSVIQKVSFNLFQYIIYFTAFVLNTYICTVNDIFEKIKFGEQHHGHLSEIRFASTKKCLGLIYFTENTHVKWNFLPLLEHTEE